MPSNRLQAHSLSLVLLIFSLWDVEPNNVLIETDSMNINPVTSSSVNGLDYELLGNVSMDNDIMSIFHVPELTQSEWNWGVREARPASCLVSWWVQVTCSAISSFYSVAC